MTIPKRREVEVRRPRGRNEAKILVDGVDLTSSIERQRPSVYVAQVEVDSPYATDQIQTVDGDLSVDEIKIVNKPRSR